MGGRSMKDVRGAVLAGSTPPFLGRERAAVDVDVGPERRSPRYHETCLALESVEEGSAAVSEPRCVWLRVHIVKDLEKARRLPVRVEEQQAQQLAVNPPRSAGDGRQEIQLTAMVQPELPVLQLPLARFDVDGHFPQKKDDVYYWFLQPLIEKPNGSDDASRAKSRPSGWDEEDKRRARRTCAATQAAGA